MSTQLFLSTSGTSPTVTIVDLGAITYNHPTVNFELLLPSGIFTKEEIAESADLQAELDLGTITITDPQGNPVTDLANQAATDSYVKVSLDDTTAGTLTDKIDASGVIIGTIQNAAGNETISLAVNPANKIPAVDVAFDDSGVPAGSPAEGTTDAQAALEAINTQSQTNETNITAINTSIGQPNGIAPLNAAGELPNSVLPDLAITNTVTVADIPARDALGWGADQEGDVAIVIDAGDDPNIPAGQSATYIWTGSAFVQLVDGGKVYSVNGEEGVVQLDAVDIPYDETGAPVGSPTDGETELQGAVDALNVAVDSLATSNHPAATSGNDAIGVTVGQVITLELDTTTNGGNNIAVITGGEGLYVDPDAATNTSYLHAGLNTNQNQSSFLRLGGGGGDFTNNNPYRLGFDIEIIRIDAFNRSSDTDGWELQVYINGTISATLTTTVPATQSSATLVPVSPVLVTAGQGISMRFVNTSGRIQRPNVLVHYRVV